MFRRSIIFALLTSILMVGCNEQQEIPFTIDFEKYQLDNGLTVILHEDKSDPIVGVAIQYHVGSNRETPGRTGFAHLFEHMLFQESQHVGQDQFFKTIQNVGGTLNGGTNKDGTVYYEIVPNNALETVLWLDNNSPMVFGAEKNKGIRLEGNTPKVIEIGDKWSIDDVLVHDESDYVIASLLSNMTYNPDFPDPVGVLYAVEDVTYEDMMMDQLNEAVKKKDKSSIQDIINSGDTWVVK